MHPSWHLEQLLFACLFFFRAAPRYLLLLAAFASKSSFNILRLDLSGRTCTLGIIADTYRNAFLFGLRIWLGAAGSS